MRLTAELSPPNSIIFLMDFGSEELPTKLDGLITVTPTCIAIGTFCDVDGPSTIVFDG
jgi:hypothetical protein